jgi:SAM-dependent methyltransferase
MTWRVHTRGVVDLQGLDTGGANLDHAVEYHPTRVREFWAVMSHLRIPTGGQGFVDFGCGKGRVLIMASEYGFEHVSGVEFAAELHDVAQNNVRRYLGLSKMRTRFNLVHGDAATYRIEPCQSVFYFYFPFKDTVMQAVMDNIRASLRDYPRQAYLVYNYPKCREIVEGMSIFELVLNAKFWGNSWRAYVSRGSVS